VQHLPPSIVEVKNEWTYTSTPLICLYGKNRHNFTTAITATAAINATTTVAAYDVYWSNTNFAAV
jgi:hypothetical protein